MMAEKVYIEQGQDINTQYHATWGQWGRSYPKHLGAKDADPVDGDFLGLSYHDRWRLSTPALFNSYFDLGIRQVTSKAAPGTYHYLCTRNNNFSNRSQKGKLVVLPTPVGELYAEPSYVFGEQHSAPGLAKLRFNYDVRQSGQQEIRIEDAGPSGYASNWVRVIPNFLALPDKGSIDLVIYHDWYPFTYGRIYWAESKNSEKVELKTNYETFAESGTGTASARIMQGGYFVVVNDVNGSALGGLIVGLVLITLGVYYFRKRFGCRLFNKAAKGGDANANLLAGGAPTSDSASTAIPVSTSSASPTTTS